MMKLELELKTRLEQELEQAEQAVAEWEQVLAKLSRHLPEPANLGNNRSTYTPGLEDLN